MHHELTMKNYKNQLSLWIFLKDHLLDLRILFTGLEREREREEELGGSKRVRGSEREESTRVCVCVHAI